MEEKEKEVVEMFGKIFGKIAFWFINTAFIMWGWNTIAPHLNAPMFDYWEMFAIRMGFANLIAIIWKK